MSEATTPATGTDGPDPAAGGIRIAGAFDASEDLDAARALIRDYFHSWGLEEIDDPDLLDELNRLEHWYREPEGALLVARVGDAAAGVVGMRPQAADICVMKRMFVRPEYRRAGVGRALAVELMGRAARAGYAHMLLDTPADNDRALRLYRSLGFAPTEPYMEPGHDHVHENWAFLQIELGAPRA